MDKALEQLIKISHPIGSDSSLVVGTGGNTSVKTEDGRYMYIKASGAALKDMNPKFGWRRLKIESVYEIFHDKTLARMDKIAREVVMIKRLQSTCDDDCAGAVRPSVESLLHVVLDRYVIHLHALPVLAYACCKDGKSKFLNLFIDESYPPLWIPYTDPGFALSKRVYNFVKRYLKQYGKQPAIMILEKHGLLVADNHEHGVMQLTRKVIERCNKGLREPPVPRIPQVDADKIEVIKQIIRKALNEVTGQDTPISYFTNQTVASFAAREDAARLLRVPALTPDEMGFLSSPVIRLAKYDYKTIADKIRAHLARRQKPPIAFLIKEVGLFITGPAKLTPILKEIIAGTLFVRSHAKDMGGINPLNKRQRYFIDHWEGEKFRVKFAGH